MLQTVNTIKELLFLVTRSVPQQYVVNILYLGGKYICKQHTAPHVTMDVTEALVHCHILPNKTQPCKIINNIFEKGAVCMKKGLQ